jgi:hypothetical protein
MNRNNKLVKKPFFTRFLDQQSLETITGGTDIPKQTEKFPSDSDETVSS